MKQVYELTNVKELKADKNLADGKSQNIKAGKMSHTCKFPCIYGSCVKNVYSKRKNYVPTEEEIKNEGEWTKGLLKSRW